ncbi:RNA-binding S4 domain-containing protein [Capnocytophaga leadbetteri]|uniref:RNA-binding S4 domain-containing protein n=1 Tax=Capnocytophaga leadbetteri TaxID=327575 RepID=UPI0028D7381A|nr:RNA-binding S4 domain-containing protein [Capnocytophaga leadbetteri]
MRIDKYLWCVRYYKTRNIATEACKKGHIRINGETVKPSREVYKNDSITVRKNQINYQLEVLNIPESRVGAKLVNLYRQDNTPPEAFEQAELQQLAQDYYREKGEGRPTKKDRRAIDNLLNDFQEDTDDELL